MAAFILVHGTFAKHALWTLDGSTLRTRIAAVANEVGQLSHFTLVPWGGRNLGRDRLAAADAIATQVKAISTTDNGEKIFLIGHSHGGSAIAYFLKAYPEIRTRVAGVAFLSTPFIATRLRPQWSLFLRALLFSFAIMLLFIVFGVVTWINLHVWTIYFREQFSELVFVPLGILLGLSLAYFVWRKSEKKLAAYIESELPRKLDFLATVNIPAGNYLYLRAIGDEAAGILSVAQFFSWIMSIIGAMASLPIAICERSWYWLVRTTRGKIIAAALVFLFAFWGCLRIAASILDQIFCRMFTRSSGCGVISTLHFWLMPSHMPLGYPSLKWLLEPIDNIQFVLSPAFSAAVILTVCYSALLLFVVTISAVSQKLFGWIELGAALFSDFAVEPTPDGAVTLIHVDWKAQIPETIFALNHSKTYDNPIALDCLTKWISAHL